MSIWKSVTGIIFEIMYKARENPALVLFFLSEDFSLGKEWS